MLDKIKNLCSPAMVYLVISFFSILSILIQNLNNNNMLNVGSYKINVHNNITYFVGHTLYVLVWTFILNFLCKKGYSKLSWLLVILPFIFIFIFILSMISLIFGSTLNK